MKLSVSVYKMNCVLKWADVAAAAPDVDKGKHPKFPAGTENDLKTNHAFPCVKTRQEQSDTMKGRNNQSPQTSASHEPPWGAGMTQCCTSGPNLFQIKLIGLQSRADHVGSGWEKRFKEREIEMKDFWGNGVWFFFFSLPLSSVYFSGS